MKNFAKVVCVADEIQMNSIENKLYSKTLERAKRRADIMNKLGKAFASKILNKKTQLVT